MNLAAQALCSIAYMGKDWKAVGDVADSARAVRYRLHDSAARLNKTGQGVRHTDDNPDPKYEAEWLGDGTAKP